MSFSTTTGIYHLFAWYKIQFNNPKTDLDYKWMKQARETFANSPDRSLLQSHFPTKVLRFFSHCKYSLLSLYDMYSSKKFVVLGLIPLISRYLWNAFCRFSSRSLGKGEEKQKRVRKCLKRISTNERFGSIARAYLKSGPSYAS